MQSNFITWQLAAFSQIMGGVIAGANSRHGAIYGFWVGILTAAFVIIVPSLADAPAPDVSTWILGGAAVDSRPAALLITGISVVLIRLFGRLAGRSHFAGAL